MVQQFKAFLKKGTLASSFVAAGSSSSTSSIPVVVEPFAERQSKEEILKYNAFLRGEKEGEGVGDDTPVTDEAVAPKIVFKRAFSDVGQEGGSEAKQARTDGGLKPGWGKLKPEELMTAIGPQVIPLIVKEPEKPPETVPDVDSEEVTNQYGYDWSQGTYRGAHTAHRGARGQGGAWAGVRPGDWPCAGTAKLCLVIKPFLLPSQSLLYLLKHLHPT